MNIASDIYIYTKKRKKSTCFVFFRQECILTFLLQKENGKYSQLFLTTLRLSQLNSG